MGDRRWGTGDLPFNGNGHEREHASTQGKDSEKLRNFTINPAKRPVVGQHTDKIEDDVKRRRRRVGYR